ncbi:MAG: hypothetical protein LBF16_05535, partial [Pseudomonadales bacterium]|nr:hypothetical protein [Pseudomonadales bacterium]
QYAAERALLAQQTQIIEVYTGLISHAEEIDLFAYQAFDDGVSDRVLLWDATYGNPLERGAGVLQGVGGVAAGVAGAGTCLETGVECAACV